MRSSAIAIAAFAVLLPGPGAAAEPLVYAEAGAHRSLPDGKGTMPTLVAIFAASGAFLALDVRLVRDSSGRHFKPALDRGYRLYCGTWSRAGDGPLSVSAKLLESYRFPATETAKTLWQPARTLALSGAPVGELTATLSDERAMFVALPELPFSDDELKPFLLVCNAAH